eukprot:gene6674-8256_t
MIVIPTVPRKGDTDYLSTTIQSIESQLEDVLDQWTDLRISIYIQNNNNYKYQSYHHTFYNLKERYRNRNETFTFQDNDNPILDEIDEKNLPSPDDFDNPFDKPGKKVRQQTLDIVSLFKKVKGKSDYILFIEDDFPFCPSSLSIFNYIIKKSNIYDPNWNIIRTSFGMNGLIIKSSEIELLEKYLYGNRFIKPADLLISEWICGMREIGLTRNEICKESQRKSLTFRFNLFNHIGKISSLRNSGLNNPAKCWEDYSYLLTSYEQFDESQCEQDDISPCPSYIPTRSMITELDKWSYLTHYIRKVKTKNSIDIQFVQRKLPPIFSIQDENANTQDQTNNNNRIEKDQRQKQISITSITKSLYIMVKFNSKR